MAENKMDIDKACEIISNMRWEEDMPGVYTHSERENTALWMAYRALEFCKKNGFADYNDFVECGEEAENELKPCQCGSDVELCRDDDDYYVYCPKCKLKTFSDRVYDNITDNCDRLIDAWNGRADNG